jgi:methyl-accepting chemotaxis protein
MTIGRRIYLQFSVAVLPLAVLLGFLALGRDDLPQRVNASLRAYDLALESANGFKDFLTGVADAIDSGRLASNAVAALQRARAAEATLAQESPGEQPLAKRLDALAQAVSASTPVSALMPLKNEAQSLRTALLESADAKRQALTQLVEAEDATARRKREFLIAAVGGAILLLGFIGYVLRRLVAGITQPLSRSVEAAHEIAEGNLSNRIDARGNDEIAQLQRAMRAMQEHLSHLVLAVRSGAQSVAGTSQALSRETRDLSHRTEAQAASLEEAAASMEELSTAVKQNSHHAKRANQLAQTASGSAVEGSAAVKRVVETMQEITGASRRIEEIVAVIDSIAFQTNILALNAAVEAARAGEQGRGFAVVASEVRALAQRAGDAAKDIRGIIALAAGKVVEGSRQVDEAGHSIEVLVQGVQEVSALMGEIATASLEQERGIEQVSASVTQMDGVVQQNAHSASRNASESEKLRRDAEELAQTVSRFRVGEEREAALPEAHG